MMNTNTEQAGWRQHIVSTRNLYELPMLSWLTVEKLLQYYREHMEIVFELILAGAILICAFVLIRRVAKEWGVRPYVSNPTTPCS